MSGQTYNDRVVRQFAIAALAWGALALLTGLVLTAERLAPDLPLPPQLAFGRLHAAHGLLALFAFAGNLIFAGIYYSSQRLLGVRVPSERLAAVHVWGWQAAVAAGAVTLLLGHGQSRPLAEVEWPIDLAIAALWLIFAAQLAVMVRRRTEARLHIALWFYIAAVVGFGALHLASALAIPVGPLESVPLLSGAADALLQAICRDGAVAFLVTAPLLGLLYHFLPRAAERPLHSYRLSLIHFWGFVLIAGWTAPRALLDSALPDDTQTLGVVFSLLFVAPAWAGAWNGLLTLRGAGARLRRDPVLKFIAAALLLHGLAAAEGALLGARSAAEVARYSDWSAGDLHLGGPGLTGFSGFLIAAALYYMVPRLWRAPLRSPGAAHAHFYLATVALLVDLAAARVAGATQGDMWREQDAAGGLTYNFVQTVIALDLPTAGRLVAGGLSLAGFLLMAWNLLATARRGAPEPEPVARGSGERAGGCARKLLLSQPIAFAVTVALLLAAAPLIDPLAALVAIFVALVVAIAGLLAAHLARRHSGRAFHPQLEASGAALAALIAVAVLIGPVAELAPLAAAAPPDSSAAPAPYSPLQLAGRQIYLDEGCAACHSQMVRPFLWEVARYGEVSSAADSAFDHPAQWGLRRIGPDLARVGGRYPHLWHYQHLVDPRAVTFGSNMPSYAHLAAERIDLDAVAARMRALGALGVPYAAADIERARDAALAEGSAIAEELARAGAKVAPDSGMVALIAYLQRLGQAEKEPAP